MPAKPLEQMSLKELWELFPISLEDYNEEWPRVAVEEIYALRSLLGDNIVSIYHIGSTAIKGIKAKPIIDILIESNGPEAFARIKGAMLGADYICMAESASRLSFNKGYTRNGYADKVFHIHVAAAGHIDEVTFRDYLRSHPAAARKYESLKLSLLPKFRNNRDGYTRAKTNFVKAVMRIASAKTDDCTPGELLARLTEKLQGRIGKKEVDDIAAEATVTDRVKQTLWALTKSPGRRVAVNALWVITHLPKYEIDWLASLQDELIEWLIDETDASKKRMLLQLLREQQFNADNENVVKLLDFCLPKINAESEPYAVRCFSLYVAYKICRPYPELISELSYRIELLKTQTLSPGLRSALRQISSRVLLK